MGKKWAKFCGWMLRDVMGWTADSPACPEKKCVILGAPHTSMWDFPVSYFYYAATGKKAYVMIKKDMFFWPLGPILKSLGGIPMDRKNPTGSIKGIIDEMKDDEFFHLSMCPEGTRKPVHKWKTGYHVIAKALDCPVYLGYFDWGTKHIGRGEKFELTDNAREDTDRIQKRYAEMGVKGKHPEMFVTE